MPNLACFVYFRVQFVLLPAHPSREGRNMNVELMLQILGRSIRGERVKLGWSRQTLADQA